MGQRIKHRHEANQAVPRHYHDREMFSQDQIKGGVMRDKCKRRPLEEKRVRNYQSEEDFDG
jgi:hypothetical protein